MDAMRAVAKAHEDRSLAAFQAALQVGAPSGRMEDRACPAGGLRQPAGWVWVHQSLRRLVLCHSQHRCCCMFADLLAA